MNGAILQQNVGSTGMLDAQTNDFAISYDNLLKSIQLRRRKTLRYNSYLDFRSWPHKKV